MRGKKISKFLLIALIMNMLIFSIPAIAGAITVNEVSNNTIMAGNDMWPITSSQLTASNLSAAYTAAGTTRSFYKHANGWWFNVINITKSADLSDVSKTYSNDRVLALKNLSKYYKSAGTQYFGPIINTTTLESETGLFLSNGVTSASPGGISFTASADSANPTGPIGVVKYVFDRNINKNISAMKIYINGATTEPANADVIKDLLFDKFGTNATDDAKTLTGSTIPLSVSELKSILISAYGVTADTNNMITIKFEVTEDTTDHTPATSYTTLVIN